MKDKITVIGSMNYDVIMKISHLPQQGETLPAEDVKCTAGGKGANQAVQAAKLGVKTYMVGCVGDDAHGDTLLQTAQKYGLDTRYIRKTDAPTGMGVVYAVEDGSVYTCIARGANFSLTREDIDAAAQALQESALVILQMEIPLEIDEYAIEKAKGQGCKVLLNTAPAAGFPEKYLQMCDILVLNEVEAAFYLKTELATVDQAKEGAARLAGLYGADIIITLGKAGAVVSDRGQVSFIPAKEVQAIETTGAGDSFIGGTAYALLQGMSLTAACEFATACSAVTVCRLGAQDSMPTLEEVRRG